VGERSADQYEGRGRGRGDQGPGCTEALHSAVPLH
jgi:hypothetical protein